MDDADGFEQWYRETRPRLLRSLVLACGGDVDSATEATDEAFVRALERWSRVHSMESPAAWTYRTALNLVKRRHRRAGTESASLRTMAAGLEPHSGATEEALRRVELWNVVAGMDARERTALALRYLGDLTEAEVAAAMGIRTGAASSLLSRARTRLRSVLQRSEAHRG